MAQQAHALTLSATEEKIAGRIDPNTTKSVAISSQAGGLAIADMAQAMEFAKMMALGGISVPQHLRGQPGACMAVVIQAVEWRMSPYAVANKSYSVNNRLAYESQLVQAVILQRAPIKGRFKIEYKGEGDKRRCTVRAELNDGSGETVEYTSPEFGKIPVKNSPLWKGDPDQQLFYYSGRALCRRHFPDVLLGIYTPDEIQGPARTIDVTPKRDLSSRLDALASEPEAPIEAEVIDPQAVAGEESQLPQVEPDEMLDVPPADMVDDEEEEDTTPRAQVLARAREVALDGPKKLKFFLGKLPIDEYELLTNEDIRELEAAAKRAEG